MTLLETIVGAMRRSSTTRSETPPLDAEGSLEPPQELPANTKHSALSAAIILSICVLSDWLKIPSCDVSQLLDGSWMYALTRLRQEQLFSGTAFFTTYGPLAQHLGPMIVDGQLPTLPYYLLGALLVATVFLAVWQLGEACQPLRSASGFFFMAFVVGMVQIHWMPLCDVAFNCLAPCIYLAMYLRHNKRIRFTCLTVLLILAVVSLQIKFNWGVHFVAVFLVGTAFVPRKRRLIFLLLSIALLIVSSYLVFFLLTGTLDLIQFVRQNLSIASHYSEVMPLSGIAFRHYVFLALFSALFAGLIIAVAFSHRIEVQDRWALVLSGAISSFVLFKAGCVRADAIHYVVPYYSLLPAITVLAAVGLTVAQRRLCRVSVLGLAVAAVITFAVAVVGNRPTLMPYDADKFDHVRGIVRGGGFKRESELVEELRASFPNLFSFLDGLEVHSPNGKPWITFLPHELIFALGTPAFRLSPTPSLQAYVECQLENPRELVQRYLRSDLAPSVIVLGSSAIDRRNQVADFTYWLQPLLSDFRLIGERDGYAVLIRNESTLESKNMVCSKEGPGSFLRIRLAPLEGWRKVGFRAAMMLFKAPETYITISLKDGNGRVREVTAKAFPTVLERGVFFSDKSLPRLISVLHEDRPLDLDDVITHVQEARLHRQKGAWNLPVIKESLPLEIEYCRVCDSSKRSHTVTSTCAQRPATPLPDSP
jgi:hypothetical protein